MTLKERTLYSLIWSTIDRFGYVIIMFISNLFLARLLTPSDFGIIAMIMIFIAISSAIVDSGFASALIQKKEIDSVDYSTVYVVNTVLSLFIYLVIFLIAPIISRFYENEALVFVLRVSGLVLIVNAMSIVQTAKFKRELNFKYIGIISIVSSIIGCSIGVIMAFHGYSYWSLVFQTLIIAIIRSFLLFYLSPWKPSFHFSSRSFCSLFKFGSMILFSSILDTIYTNMIPLILGKSFSSRTLGNYTQARTLEGVSNQTILTVINQVLFPVFSSIQSDRLVLKKAVRKSMKMLSYINFSLMFLLILIADPLLKLLYTEKWIDAIPLFRIACFGGMMNCIVQINLMILSSLGNGKLFFISRLVRQICGLSLIFIGIYFGGLMGLMWIGIVVTSYVFALLSVFYTKKVLNYGYKEQFFDVFPNLFICSLCGFICLFLFHKLNLNNISLVLIESTTFILLLLLFSKVFRLSAFSDISFELKSLLQKHN